MQFEPSRKGTEAEQPASKSLSSPLRLDHSSSVHLPFTHGDICSLETDWWTPRLGPSARPLSGRSSREDILLKSWPSSDWRRWPRQPFWSALAKPQTMWAHQRTSG